MNRVRRYLFRRKKQLSETDEGKDMEGEGRARMMIKFLASVTGKMLPQFSEMGSKWRC